MHWCRDRARLNREQAIQRPTRSSIPINPMLFPNRLPKLGDVKTGPIVLDDQVHLSSFRCTSMLIL
jgi:hypothetical protein